MATCSNCGNEYDHTFKVEVDGAAYQFDCFECAIQLLAPTCHHCHTRIIGHGVQDDDMVFCCAHCARRRASGPHRSAGLDASVCLAP